MRLNVVCSVLSLLVLFVGAAQLVPLGISIAYGDGDFFALLFSCLAAFAAGGIARYLTRHVFGVEGHIELRHREGFAIVGLGWVLISAFGCLPFLLAGTFLPSAESAGAASRAWTALTDSYFETVSGFTTTGASVLTDYDQPHGLMFWRSMTHWIGGMGIILFSIAILPLLGTGGMQLFKAEVPGPVKDRLTPRIADTAKLLWTVYLALTVLQTLLLHFVGDMPLFDSVCHTFGTMATGGFSTYSTSLIDTSRTVQYIVTFFMLLAGMNFALHFRALKVHHFPRNLVHYIHNPECRFYLLCIGIGVLLVLAGHVRAGNGVTEGTFRASLFQVVSITTTTGYVSEDYSAWRPIAHVTLFWLMFCGGCAGSTGGGVKMMRALLAVKASVRELRRLAQPRAVLVVRMGETTVPEQVIGGVLVFLLIYALVFLLSTVALAAGGYDFVTSMAASVATLANIGPGLGLVGPVENFAHFATWQKWLLSLNMLMGRLDLFAIIILFVPRFWRR